MDRKTSTSSTLESGAAGSVSNAIKYEEFPALQVVEVTKEAIQQLDAGNYSVAQQLFAQALSLTPRQADLMYGQAVATVGLGDTETAREILEEILAFEPNYQRAEILLAQCSQETSEYAATSESVPDYTAALREGLEMIGQQVMPSIAAHMPAAESGLSPKQGAALYVLAAQGPGMGEVLEIGSVQGYSTVWLAQGCKLRGAGTVFSVESCKRSTRDMTIRRQALQNDLRRFELQTWAHVMGALASDCARAWQRPLRLLFIDNTEPNLDLATVLIDWQRHLDRESLIAVFNRDTAGVDQTKTVLQAAGRFLEVSDLDGLYIAQRG